MRLDQKRADSKKSRTSDDKTRMDKNSSHEINFSRDLSDGPLRKILSEVNLAHRLVNKQFQMIVDSNPIMKPIIGLMPGRSKVISGITKKKGNMTKALHWATENGYTKVVTELLQAGADPNAEDNSGWTPLHWAARNGYVGIVTALLENGANLEAKDELYGRTPLHLATYKGHAEVVEKLLAAGADMYAIDNTGTTMLDRVLSSTFGQPSQPRNFEELEYGYFD